MTLYKGATYRDGNVSIGVPNPEQIHNAPTADDVSEDGEDGLAWAWRDENVYCFAVYNRVENISLSWNYWEVKKCR